MSDRPVPAVNVKGILRGALAVLLGGCATIPSAPFQNFHQSVEKAQSGLQAEMDRDVSWAREAEIQSVADRKDAALSGYMLKEAAGFRWSMSHEPDYWGPRSVGRALGALNAAFLGYAALLASVASGEAADAARFDAMAKELNGNLRGLGDTLVKLDALGKGDDRRAPRIAGLSAGVSEAFRAFIRSRRLRDLKAAIVENQPWVENDAALCLSLIDLIRGDLKASYADQLESIQKRWDDKRAPGRATLTRSLFTLNEEYVDAMESLRALSEFYGNLPAAHAELGASLKAGGRGKAALAALGESAARVARLKRDLEKAR